MILLLVTGDEYIGLEDSFFLADLEGKKGG